MPAVTRLVGGRRVLRLSGPPTRWQRWLLDRNPAALHVVECGADVRSLDFLLPWADRIEYLTVTDLGIRDVHALAECRNLVELDLWPGRVGRAGLSLDLWPALTQLACPGRVGIAVSAGHPLQGLMLVGPTAEHL